MFGRTHTLAVIDEHGHQPINTDDMIFVFGSNEAGRHGGGAARFALTDKGAIYGVGFGLCGKSFAVPTKDLNVQTLPILTINNYIRSFLYFAAARKDLSFQVTQLGCGLAGFQAVDIAPLFQQFFRENGGSEMFPNLYFDLAWSPYLCAKAKFWGTM